MRKSKILNVSSSEFAGKFGQWSFNAQQAPVKVVNQKTGSVLGYFISAQEFDEYERVRELIPRSAPAWEISPNLAAQLDKPTKRLRPELDHLMDE